MPELRNNFFCRKCAVNDFGTENDCDCKPTQDGKTNCFGYLHHAPEGGGCEYCPDQEACFDVAYNGEKDGAD